MLTGVRSEHLAHWMFHDGVPIHEEFHKIDMKKIRAVYNQQIKTRWANIGSRESLYQSIVLLDEKTQLEIQDCLLSPSFGPAAPSTEAAAPSLSESPMVNIAGPSSFQITQDPLAVDEDELVPAPITSNNQPATRKANVDHMLTFHDGQSMHEELKQCSVINLKKAPTPVQDKI
ncbi:hypothetical protein BYT27DRAFT_7254322 [Phlegmacium glaucopus]|nr:hypothetical protein BYT27DRAFT_7254322 [Phlegmacium glaucopus]